MTEEVKAKRDITVARPFLFTYPKGEQRRFEVGVHRDVGDDVADHWYTMLHLLPDGEKLPAMVDVSDPDATRRRILSLEDSVIRLEAEVRQQKDRADQVEADLADARSKADRVDALVKDHDATLAENASLKVDIERLTKPKADVKASGKSS